MIRRSGRRLIPVAAAIALAVGAGCGPRNDGRPVRDFPPFLAFGCEGEARFLALFAGRDSVRLVAADGIHTLLRVRSASGARYAGPTDTLWTKGQEALLIRGPRIHRRCTATGRQRVLADLRRQGAVFAAAGNEPFWTLTAWPDSMVLSLDMGGARLTHRFGPEPRPVWDDLSPHDYADDPNGVAVSVRPGPCLDTMSGEPFPAEVAVRWAGHKLRGCGIALRPTAP